MKVLFILIIVISQSLFPQNLVDLFEEHIPKILTENVESRDDIESVLRYNAEIHPDLIYYYIKHLKSLFEDKVTNPDSNYLNLLKFNRNKYLIDRSVWAGIQLQNIEKVTSLRLKRNAMGQFYEDLTLEFQPEKNKLVSLEVDNNLLEFFTYLYITQKKSEYEVGKDYASGNSQIIKTNISEMNKEKDNFSSFNDEQKFQKITRDTHHWYLMGDNSENNHNAAVNYHVSELSIQMFDKAFLTKNAFTIGVGFNGFLVKLENISNTFNFSDKPFPTFTNPIVKDFPVNLEYYPMVCADLGYQWALKPELERFSYLKIKVGYTFMTAKYEDDNDGKEFYSYTYHVVSGSEKQKLVYISEGLTNKKNHAGYVKLSTPVFYLDKNLYLEFGLDLLMRINQFDYNVTRNDVRQINNQETIEGSKDYNFSFKQNKLNISPSFSIVIAPTDMFTIGINNSVVWKSYLLNLSLSIIL